MTAMTSDQLHDQAVQAVQAGNFAEAESLCRSALASNPDQPAILHLLAGIVQRTNRAALGLQLLERACVLSPADANLRAAIAMALASAGQVDRAIEEHKNAIKLGRADAILFSNLGGLLSSKGRLVEAESALNQAINLDPKNANALYNLGGVLGHLRRYDEALDVFTRALAIEPTAMAYINQGIILGTLGRSGEAITCFQKAIALRPDSADAHTNLGNALKNAGRFTEAAAASRRAIAIDPNAAIAHHNLGHILLLTGDLENGWPEYEWRDRALPSKFPNRRLVRPRWDGSPLTNQRVFIFAEQGFGDTIQFARYLPIIAAKTGPFTFECQPALHRLIAKIPGIDRLIAPGQSPGPFDFHCPLMSVPLTLRTNLNTIPHEVPYLSPDPTQIAEFRARLDKNRLNVGLIWSGTPTQVDDANRSLSLDQLAPLGNIPNVRFYSLQKGPRAVQAKNPPAGMDLIDWTGSLNDFADTAALMSALDLIITTDTGPAHLAGAIARPTWLFVQNVPDWRWLLDREDSPWYPTMRLFRQSPSPGGRLGEGRGKDERQSPTPANWSIPINTVAAALAQLALEKSHS